MRPGQLTPNEFELAILERLASKTPSLTNIISRLHVLSRKFTGVGSYTDFNPDPSLTRPELGEQQLGLDALIVVPGVPNGMGAVLVCAAGYPLVLETFTYGNDHWDGVFDGFSFA
jgi:hypothetical protein